MTFDMEQIVRSKREFRDRLAALPITEKLRMLDELRERALSIRGATILPAPASVADDEARREGAK